MRALQCTWKEGDGVKRKSKYLTSAEVSDGVVVLKSGVIYKKNRVDYEYGVFEQCRKLKTVRLPISLKTIGDHSFSNCKALVRIDIPSGVVDIGQAAFSSCIVLKTISLPEGVVDLPKNVFYNCKSLKSVKLPSSLKTIGSSAFSLCSSLVKINSDDLKNVTI